MNKPVAAPGEVLYFYFYDMKTDRNVLSMETSTGAKIELSAPDGKAQNDLDVLVANFYWHMAEAVSQLQDYEGRWFEDQFAEITAPLDDLEDI